MILLESAFLVRGSFPRSLFANVRLNTMRTFTESD